MVDNNDFKELSKFKWTAAVGGKYAARDYVFFGERRTVYMHQQIVGTKNVDHKNANGLDNRRRNLRKCTRNQNMQNARKRKRATSRFKGVSKHPLGPYWTARCQHEYLGNFSSQVGAAKAYNKQAKQLFGKFARLNKI